MRKATLKNDKEEFPIESNWAIIGFGYSEQMVLPIEEATQLLSLLESAYQFVQGYGGDVSTIKPLKSDITIKMINGEQYKEYKRNYILGVNSENSTD